MSTVENSKMVKSSAEIVDELFRELQEKSVSSIDFGGFPLSEIQHKAVELRETNDTKDVQGSSSLGDTQEKQRESSANDSLSGSSDRTKSSRKKHKHKKKKKRSAESEKRHRHKHRKRKKSHDSDTKSKHKHKRKKSCSDYEWEPKEVSETSEQHKKKLDCVSISPDIKCSTVLSKEKGESSVNEQSALGKHVQENSVESQIENGITTSTLQSGSNERSKLPSDNSSKLKSDENSINNALVSSTSDLSSISELCSSSKNDSLESSKSSTKDSVVVKTIESADTTTSEDIPGKKAEKLDSAEPKINFATDDKMSVNSSCDLNLGKSNTVNSDKKGESDVKQKGKIVIKDLKSSLVFQQVVEEAKKIAEIKENEKTLKEEDASSQDSNQDSGSSGKSSESADSEVDSPKNKSSQPDHQEVSGEDESKDILPKELKKTENSTNQSKDHEDSDDPDASKKSKTQKSSSSSKRKKRDRRSRSSRSSSKHRHHHHHSTRKHSKSTHKYKKSKRTHSRSRSTSRGRSRTKSKSRSRTRSWTRSRSRSRSRGRSWSRSRDRYRSRSHSPRRKTKSHTREKIDKAKLLEIARKNAVMMINRGNLPPGVSLDNIKQDQLLAIKAGGKSVEELTDFCKQLALKEGNEHSSDDGNKKSSSDNEGTEPFIHHPFKLRDSQPNIVMNIRNAVQLPVRTPAEKAAEAAKLRIQFPVSSGSQHRKKELEWVPVVPEPEVVSQPAPSEPMNDKVFSEPEPQLVLPIDVSTIVSQRLKAVRKLQENPNDVEALNQMYQVQQQMQNWAQSKQLPGQFTGSTNARILTPEELAGPIHTQAWVKKVSQPLMG